MADTYGCTLQDCIEWLDAKAKRHGEFEEAAAATYLRRLAEAVTLVSRLHKYASERKHTGYALDLLQVLDVLNGSTANSASAPQCNGRCHGDLADVDCPVHGIKAWLNQSDSAPAALVTHGEHSVQTVNPDSASLNQCDNCKGTGWMVTRYQGAFPCAVCNEDGKRPASTASVRPAVRDDGLASGGALARFTTGLCLDMDIADAAHSCPRCKRPEGEPHRMGG